LRYEYVSWNNFYRLCGVLYRRISESGFRPDLIVAITRGGYPPARVLSDYLDLMDLVGLKVEHYRGPDKMSRVLIPYSLPVDIAGRHILLVDDVSDSGDTFDAALEHLAAHGKPAELRTAVLHHKQTSTYVPDFHAKRVLKWRWITYPWAVVEDLTVLASRMDPPPYTTRDLLVHLRENIGFRLPAAVFEQTAQVVLERLREVDSYPE
jgi:hypoxanthine phosphoribosyltransferase